MNCFDGYPKILIFSMLIILLNKCSHPQWIVCPFHKKGDITKVKNSPALEQTIGSYQCGFQRDWPHICTSAIEKHPEYDIHLHLAFIDFTQAHDSVDRNKLLVALVELGVPNKYIRLISTCYRKAKAQVRVNETCSSSFEVATGLRQRDPLVPFYRLSIYLPRTTTHVPRRHLSPVTRFYNNKSDK